MRPTSLGELSESGSRMPDRDIQALNLRAVENLQQRAELDVAANQQSPPEECAVTAAGKNPVAIDFPVFGTLKGASQELVHGRRERGLQDRVGNPETHCGAAAGVETDLQFRGLSRLGWGLLRHGGAREETREAEPG